MRAETGSPGGPETPFLAGGRFLGAAWRVASAASTRWRTISTAQPPGILPPKCEDKQDDPDPARGSGWIRLLRRSLAVVQCSQLLLGLPLLLVAHAGKHRLIKATRGIGLAAPQRPAHRGRVGAAMLKPVWLNGCSAARGRNRRRCKASPAQLRHEPSLHWHCRCGCPKLNRAPAPTGQDQHTVISSRCLQSGIRNIPGK